MAKTCTKCNGTGNLSHYSHVLNGVCFKCGGTGKAQAKSTKMEVIVVEYEVGQYIHIEKETKTFVGILHGYTHIETAPKLTDILDS